MIASLLAVDQWLFVLLNQQVANPVFDWIFPFITQPQPWLIVAAAGAGWLVWRYRSAGMQFVLMSALAIGITDALNSRVLKPWFERQRPCCFLCSRTLSIRTAPLAVGMVEFGNADRILSNLLRSALSR